MPVVIRSRVRAPIALYDAVHAEVLRRSSGTVEGLVAHIGVPTEEGFEVIEVWESAKAFEYYTETLIGPVVATLSAGHTGPPPETTTEQEQVRGLLIPGASIVI
ncbi:hypothetical protein [Pseudonocardia xishanensis]|uniref:ABM domain-containing protein n=1 Tax=Pseudonocardia xishanensis TaxID=630995 RepID=A0ABP8RSP0_9PSEU